MQAIDYAIVGLYVLATIAIGIAARRRAARSVESYYLADKSMPWYMLGLSNASDMYDVTGTMWLVDAVRGLRAEEPVDPVAVAGLQPDLPDGLSLDLAAPLECADRRGMDRDALRHGHGRHNSRSSW